MIILKATDAWAEGSVTATATADWGGRAGVEVLSFSIDNYKYEAKY